MRNRSEIGATESDVSRPLWANFLVADWTSIANWGKIGNVLGKGKESALCGKRKNVVQEQLEVVYFLL